MKKIISVILILSCISVFAACGKEPVEDGNALETAETFVEITGGVGNLSLDESVARTLLEVYDRESLGLSKEIYEYELKLSITRFLENDACLVEAFLEKEEKPEGTFIILGQQCFVYNEKRQEYLLLTVDGPVKYTSTTENQEDTSTTAPAPWYDENNNKKLQDKFSSYSKSDLDIDKEISEYVLVVTGTTTTATDDEIVYVVRLYETNGDATNKTLAFNEKGEYVFDFEIDRYVELD